MELTLVVPGLLDTCLQQTGTGPARFFALEMLLARADRVPSPAPSPEGLLCALFGVEPPGEAEVPVGPLCRLGDGGELDDACWLRADPVHLVPDQDKLYLAMAESLPVEQEEAAALAAEFNRLFGEDGLHLEARSAKRWYLRVPPSFVPLTTPLHQAVGHHIGPLLPRGGDGIRWHAFLNEVQMLFHTSAVNRQREQQGLPAINSVWPWGAGRLPAQVAALWQRVLADDCLTRGLARLAGLPCESLPADVRIALNGDRGAVLVVYGRLLSTPDDVAPNGKLAVLRDLESAWFTPLLDALRRRRLERLTLYPGGPFAFENSPRTLRRWWRRSRPLQGGR